MENQDKCYKDWAFDFLQVRDSWKRVDKKKLPEIKVAYIDTGFDKSRIKDKNIDVKNIKLGEDNQYDFDLPGHGTLFACILHRYSFPDDNCGPRIISLKAGSSAQLPVKNVIEGIRWAIREKVDILSINVCNVYYSPGMAKLLYQAAGQGIIPLAPAGNFVRGEYTFPASLDTVIASTSVEKDGKLSRHVNANEFVDVCSPEEAVELHIGESEFKSIRALLNDVPGKKGAADKFPFLETLNNNPFSGTSFSLPMVVAAAALMKSINPGIDILRIRDIFKNRLSRKIKPDPNTRIGILNFEEAAAHAGERSKKEYGYKDQYFFQIDHDSKPGEIAGQVYDLKGELKDDIDTKIALTIFPFDQFQTKEGDNILEKQTINLQNGRFQLDLNHLKNGKYFVRVVDRSDIITGTLTIFKRET